MSGRGPLDYSMFPGHYRSYTSELRRCRFGQAPYASNPAKVHAPGGRIGDLRTRNRRRTSCDNKQRRPSVGVCVFRIQYTVQKKSDTEQQRSQGTGSRRSPRHATRASSSISRENERESRIQAALNPARTAILRSGFFLHGRHRQARTRRSERAGSPTTRYACPPRLQLRAPRHTCAVRASTIRPDRTHLHSREAAATLQAASARRLMPALVRLQCKHNSAHKLMVRDVGRTDQRTRARRTNVVRAHHQQRTRRSGTRTSRGSTPPTQIPPVPSRRRARARP